MTAICSTRNMTECIDTRQGGAINGSLDGLVPICNKRPSRPPSGENDADWIRHGRGMSIKVRRLNGLIGNNIP